MQVKLLGKKEPTPTPFFFCPEEYKRLKVGVGDSIKVAGEVKVNQALVKNKKLRPCSKISTVGLSFTGTDCVLILCQIACTTVVKSTLVNSIIAEADHYRMENLSLLKAVEM